MTSREFCYWVQGLLELGEPQTLTAKQVAILKKHLNMVFFHEIDPSYEGKEELLEIHNGNVGSQGSPGVTGGFGNGMVSDGLIKC